MEHELFQAILFWPNHTMERCVNLYQYCYKVAIVWLTFSPVFILVFGIFIEYFIESTAETF